MPSLTPVGLNLVTSKEILGAGLDRAVLEAAEGIDSFVVIHIGDPSSDRALIGLLRSMLRVNIGGPVRRKKFPERKNALRDQGGGD